MIHLVMHVGIQHLSPMMLGVCTSSTMVLSNQAVIRSSVPGSHVNNVTTTASFVGDKSLYVEHSVEEGSVAVDIRCALTGIATVITSTTILTRFRRLSVSFYHSTIGDIDHNNVKGRIEGPKGYESGRHQGRKAEAHQGKERELYNAFLNTLKSGPFS